MQELLLLLAPALFAASIYMVLGRIILLVDGEKSSVIRSKWLTKLFVAGDVLSFLVQSAGKTHPFSSFQTVRIKTNLSRRWWTHVQSQ